MIYQEFEDDDPARDRSWATERDLGGRIRARVGAGSSKQLARGHANSANDSGNSGSDALRAMRPKALCLGGRYGWRVSLRARVAISAALVMAATEPVSIGRSTDVVQAAVPVVACNSRSYTLVPTVPTRSTRVVLGDVLVSRRDQVASPGLDASGDAPFVYFAKMGLAIRRGSVGALIEIPSKWRQHVRISWGDVPAAVALRFRGCDTGSAWTTFAGGFRFRDKHGGCVPLRIEVDGKSETVRFSAGRHC